MVLHVFNRDGFISHSTVIPATIVEFSVSVGSSPGLDGIR